MKKSIDGKIYNTETADEICGYSFGNGGDFGRVDETLYRTKKGVFFIAGSGGCQSKFAQATGPGWVGGGSGIEVVSEKEAMAFAERHGTAEDVEKFFKVEEA